MNDRNGYVVWKHFWFVDVEKKGRFFSVLRFLSISYVLLIVE